MRKIRDYNKLVNEIINLQVPFRIEVIGNVIYDNIAYPFLSIKHIHKLAKYNIVIHSGSHGDEVIAVRVLLKFINQIKKAHLKYFNFYIFPCINPFGFAYGSRRNGARQQVNNADNFAKNSGVQELAILYNHIPINPDLFIDVHADTGKSKVYIYERKPKTFKSIAKRALQENKHIIKYEDVNSIYREKVEDGVIIKPEHDRSIDDFMGNIGVEYTLTLEIPGRSKGQQRLLGGVSILNSILKNYSKLKGV